MPDPTALKALTHPVRLRMLGMLRVDGPATARLYRVNEDADLWHALLLWRKDGNLYTLSEHVAPPLTYNHVVRYLKQELSSLVLVRPA